MTQTIAIENGIAERKALFMQLYQQAFPLVARYVSQRGGSFDDAKDLFQDTLVIYYEKLDTAPVTLRYSERSYLLGIAKHLWAKKSQQLHRHTTWEESLNGLVEENTKTSSSEKLLDLLHTSGQKCMELLRAFYYDKLPLSQITGLFGFSSIRSATVQKYKCLEKVRDTIKEKSLTYEDFLE